MQPSFHFKANIKPAMDISFKREAKFTGDVGIVTMGKMAVDDQGRVFVAEGISEPQSFRIFAGFSKPKTCQVLET